MCLPTGLDCLKIFLNVVKTHATEISFVIGVDLVPSFEFIDTFFLSLIIEVLTF